MGTQTRWIRLNSGAEGEAAAQQQGKQPELLRASDSYDGEIVVDGFDGPTTNDMDSVCPSSFMA